SPNETLTMLIGEAMNLRADAFGACREKHKDPGKLVIALALDAPAHRVTLALSGSLARSPLADCVRPLWEAAIAETQVPPDAIERTNPPYSAGSPRRFGNTTSFASAARTSSESCPSIGVSKMPGAIVTTRTPTTPRSRAAGSVIPATPAFDAA